MRAKDAEVLYRKVGRRYVPVARAFDWDRDMIPVGAARLVVAAGDGASLYEYDVTPDNAAFRAAAVLARHRIQQRISEAVTARPQMIEPYTPEQLAIIDQFKAKMVAAGALLPDWWIHITPHELADAAIGEVHAP